VHTAALIGEALGAEALVFTRRVQHQGKDRLWFKACRHLAAEEGDITCAEGTLAPHQLDSSDPIPLVASVKQREAANPWYTRWWIWTALGVAATTAVVLPLALSSPQTKYVVTQESALIRW